jgi:hypothetical protein
MKPTVSDFFDRLSITLHVEDDDEEDEASELTARVAIGSVEVYQERDDDDGYDRGTFRELFPEEWTSVAYHAPTITLVSEKCPAETFRATNGRNFSVEELVDVLVKWEQRDRRVSLWFGRVDRSHIYFEGLRDEGDGVWSVKWGS